jgi:glycosyltransferase involved in cell wall biosynthesis
VKVLILHQHFKTPYKGGAIRSYYLASALVNKGIDTIVITAHSESNYKVENVDGIEVHYLTIAYDNHFGFLKRSWSFIRFIQDSVQLAGRIKNIDLCYAISVPLTIGIAARRILSRYQIPFIFEVGDLWPEAPIQLGYIRNSFFKKKLYDLERRIYTSAKFIVALSPAIEAAVKSKVPGKDVHLIPNMSDTEFFSKSSKDPSREIKFNVKDKFVVSYIGAVGYANGLEHLISCASATAAANLPVHFMLCGDGKERDLLQNEINKYQLTNFSFVPFQNRDGVKDILNVTDAVFISYRPVPVLETGSPNKYFDGLAAGKLIVTNFGGWIKEEIEKTKCGIHVSPSNGTDFVEKIRLFVEDKSLLRSYQNSARSLAENKYSRKALSEKFHAVITNSLNQG